MWTMERVRVHGAAVTCDVEAGIAIVIDGAGGGYAMAAMQLKTKAIGGTAA